MNERYDLVIRAAYHIEVHGVGAVPFDLLDLARRFGVQAVPMSYLLEHGVSREDFFFTIGNEDGAAVRYDGACKILYNDEKPRRRVRFTLAEELMHVVLGHVDDERFAIDREYDDALYQQYEHEAKNGAGLLLMPPVLYFRLRKNYSLATLAAAFDISVEAAYMTSKFCDEHEDEIKAVYGTKFAPYCDLRGRTSSVRAGAPVSVWKD